MFLADASSVGSVAELQAGTYLSAVCLSKQTQLSK